MKTEILEHAHALGLELGIIEGTFLNEFSESETMYSVEGLRIDLTEEGILNYFRYTMKSPLLTKVCEMCGNLMTEEDHDFSDICGDCSE